MGRPQCRLIIIVTIIGKITNTLFVTGHGVGSQARFLLTEVPRLHGEASLQKSAVA